MKKEFVLSQKAGSNILFIIEVTDVTVYLNKDCLIEIHTYVIEICI